MSSRIQANQFTQEGVWKNATISRLQLSNIQCTWYCLQQGLWSNNWLQDGSPSGFYTPYYGGSSIEGPYLEGVSMTHGRSPRKHIWSFANALEEAYGYDNNRHVCPCRLSSRMQQYIPSFVGNDYFCDTGVQDNWRVGVFYPDDPLWDGQGCTLQPDCCSFHSPPWFCKKLSYSTADDIEVRICADQGYRDEDSPIKLIEVYVQ